MKYTEIERECERVVAWFKVDDNLFASRKVMAIPRRIRGEALGVWLLSGTWSAHERTDGFVPAHVIEEFGCTEAVYQALIEAGLWREQGEDIQFHDWSDYQPTREQLEAKAAEVSARRSAAGKAGAMAKWQRDGKAMANDSKGMAKDSPEPEPEPEPEPNRERVATKRGTRIPDDFALTPEMQSWADAELPGLDVVSMTALFIDFWHSSASPNAVKKDWGRAWKVWARKDYQRVAEHAKNMPEYKKPVGSPPKIGDLYCPKHYGYPNGNCERCAE